MKMPRVEVRDEGNARVWAGSLRQFILDNELGRSFARQMRSDMLRGPNACSLIGGGAAPAFYVSLQGGAA